MTLRLVWSSDVDGSRQVSDEEIDGAQRNLASFAHEQADAASGRLGFGWRASDLAPSTYDDLAQEHRACEISGLPLRVSALHCAPSIFGSASANQAMRFWHDTSHVRLGLSFNAGDEMALAAHHLEVLRAHGFRPASLEHRLLHADTSGQVLCAATLGHFPDDQLRFALLAATSGVTAAIEGARKRRKSEVPGRSSQVGAAPPDSRDVGGDAA